MRISDVESNVRKQFLTTFFTNNPGATGAQANQAVSAQFGGQKVRATTLYAVRKEVWKALNIDHAGSTRGRKVKVKDALAGTSA